MYNIKQYSNGALESIDSYDYWNDEQEELPKEWDIRDGNFDKLEEYLNTSGLNDDLLLAVNKSGLYQRKGLSGIELGGGVCWTAYEIFSKLDMKEMFYLDFSYHRVCKIAPLILEHYKIPENKISLIRGSFYETGLPDSSMDFVLLSQAFHHAYEPDRLLQEVIRILKADGVVLIIGEPKTSLTLRSCAYIIKKTLLDRKKIVCLGVDEKLGDHIYPLSSYKRMFKKNHFKYMKLDCRKDLGFILKKQ